MTPEGQHFKSSIAGKYDDHVYIYATASCTLPGCSCGGMPSISLIVGECIATSQDPAGVDDIIEGLLQAKRHAWPG